MTKPSQEVVVGLGEVLWDCFADSRRPGGAPANVAFHANQLGHRGVICSRVGTDRLGDHLLEYVRTRGLDTGYVQRTSDRPTVDSTDPERPSYVIHENAAWDDLRFDGSVEELMGGAAAVCFGTLAQRSRQSRETIHRCLSAAKTALIVYDVNLRQTWYEREWIERSLLASHVAKLNTEELRVLSELLETGPAEPAHFSGALQERFGVDLVCVTRAERGCLLIGRDGTADVPGVAVEVADAVGAGDAFTAALISAQLRGWPLSATAEFANAVGAMVAGRPGAMPPLEDDFAGLVAEFDGRARR